MWNRKFAFSVVFGLFIFIGLGNSVVHAQSTFGSIRGTTLDATGAPFPASSHLHNVDENTEVAMNSGDIRETSDLKMSSRDISGSWR